MFASSVGSVEVSDFDVSNAQVFVMNLMALHSESPCTRNLEHIAGT